MKKENTTKPLSIKQQITAKRAEVRAIVKVMANKASYERIAELNKKLSLTLRELGRLEVKANVTVA